MHAAGSALAAIGKSSKGERLPPQKALTAAERLQNSRLQAIALSDLGTARSRRRQTLSVPAASTLKRLHCTFRLDSRDRRHR